MASEITSMPGQPTHRFAETSLKEVEPIRERPTFVFLDIDKTILFDDDTQQSIHIKIEYLNRAAKIFNLCFIPTTHRGSDFLKNDEKYSEFFNLEWYAGDKTVRCPLILCEHGGVVMVRQDKQKPQFDESFGAWSLEEYATKYKPALEELSQELFDGLISIEQGLKVNTGIELTEEATKKYGARNVLNELDDDTRKFCLDEGLTAEKLGEMDEAQRAKEVMKMILLKKIVENFKLTRKSQEGVLPFKIYTNGKDLDIDPLELAEGKKLATEVGMKLLKSHPRLQAWSKYAIKSNCMIVDDKFEAAGLAAQHLHAGGGTAVASALADVEFLKLMDEINGGRTKNIRISQMIQTIAYQFKLV